MPAIAGTILRVPTYRVKAGARTMSIQNDGSLGVRRPEDAPGNHPWRWLATILGAVIICFAIVAMAGTLMNGGLLG
jgi:hypothetical protein